MAEDDTDGALPLVTEKVPDTKEEPAKQKPTKRRPLLTAAAIIAALAAGAAAIIYFGQNGF